MFALIFCLLVALITGLAVHGMQTWLEAITYTKHRED